VGDEAFVGNDAARERILVTIGGSSYAHDHADQGCFPENLD